MSPEASPTHQYNTAVLLRNPDRPKADQRIKRIQSDLHKSFPRLDIYIEDSKTHTDEYQSLINTYDDSTNNTVWLPHGGDGTFSKFAGAFPESTIMAISGGYANDIAKGLSSFNTAKQPARMIREGHTAELHPIEVITRKPSTGETMRNLAFGYYSLGWIGDVANNIDGSRLELPVLKFLERALIIIKSGVTSSNFDVVSDNKIKTYKEMTFINGPRMGKIFNFEGVELTKPHAGTITISHEKKLGLTTMLSKAALSKLKVDAYMNISSSQIFTIVSDQAVKGQSDGESTIHDPRTEFTISISPQHVNVLTNR